MKGAEDVLKTQSKKFSPAVLEHYAVTASVKRSEAAGKQDEKGVIEGEDILNKFAPARDEAKKPGEKGLMLQGPVKKEGAIETMAFVKAIEMARDDPARLNIRRWVGTEAKTEVA